MRVLIVARRVLQQLRHDRRFLVVTLFAPLIIGYFLKLFFDTMPVNVSREAFVVPFTAFIVYFLTFLLSAILLVQERTKGTLSRMLINGLRATDIILGYVVGYLTLAALQASLVLTEVLWLFKLKYDLTVLLALGTTLFILAVVSVLMGVFLSTFARREVHVFPFIPLLVLPPAFLSGLLSNPSLLPRWAELLGKIFPIRYGIAAVQAAIAPMFDGSLYWTNLGYLALFAVGFILVGSRTFRETE